MVRYSYVCGNAFPFICPYGNRFTICRLFLSDLALASGAQVAVDFNSLMQVGRWLEQTQDYWKLKTGYLRQLFRMLWREENVVTRAVYLESALKLFRLLRMEMTSWIQDAFGSWSVDVAYPVLSAGSGQHWIPYGSISKTVTFFAHRELWIGERSNGMISCHSITLFLKGLSPIKCNRNTVLQQVSMQSLNMISPICTVLRNILREESSMISNSCSSDCLSRLALDYWFSVGRTR